MKYCPRVDWAQWADWAVAENKYAIPYTTYILTYQEVIIGGEQICVHFYIIFKSL